MRFSGKALVSGVAHGLAFVAKKREPVAGQEVPGAVDVAFETEKLRHAVGELDKQLNFIKEKTLHGAGVETSRLFDVQALILGDTSLINRIEARMRDQMVSLEAAIDQVLEEYDKEFSKIVDPYLRDKFLDVKDILTRLRDRTWIEDTQKEWEHSDSSILVTEQILPSAVFAPDGNPFDGIVTVVGGLGSHATVLARAYGIPVVGVARSAVRKIKNGDRVAVDGRAGIVHVNPDGVTLSNLLTAKRRYDQYRDRIGRSAKAAAFTSDGSAVTVTANCGTLQHVGEAREHGADGIGLFRTEFIFYSYRTFPTEDEQFCLYKRAALAFPDKPVTIRTLDIGGDKILPYFLVPRQLNPYLGWRSLKISFDHPAEFKTQIKAILRAGCFGNVRLLFPMVTTYLDAQRCCEFVAQCQGELEREGKQFNPQVPRGGMIETPSAVVCLEDIARQFDFISVGSNDLTQHLLAVDRDNPRVAEFYIPHHPAVTTVLKDILVRCAALQKPVSVCGEMASDPHYVVLLLGLGLRQFSVSPSFVAICKDMIRNVAAEEARYIADEALALKTADATLRALESHLRRLYPDIDQLLT